MTVLVGVARRVPGVVVMRAWLATRSRVPVPVLVHITGLMTRVVVMLAGDRLPRAVLVPVLIDVARGVARVVVVLMLAALLVCHRDVPRQWGGPCAG
ncbi:hypothetical protein [Roseisolibacter agri]|uniref:Uncharacterized protein n=1 Tax=Roseisolibacter agri TaxID=2014610 RepID=A0AA37Q8F9_9BACT|nr:hypothetical protein [Roseisolibacter agri]GLC28194.1 hypothetical protein rosag_47070 [Roseisolibacter agri]